MQKIVVVCGPTATGKSDHAVVLAKKMGGEIISADSRQVYTGLDIGSGKITKKEMKGVAHYMLDVTSPKRTYSVSQYQKAANKIIKEILTREKTPIIAGGSGLYIDALIYDTDFPKVKPNAKLRASLAFLSTEELAQKLQKLDPRRFELIDKKNPVRLIRAIEIATELGAVPETKRQKKYDVEWIYLDFPDEVLRERIHVRLLKRIKQGMIAEVQKLREEGLSWKRLHDLGLEYRYVALYLQNKLEKQEMIEQLESAIWNYAKRQRTWFKKYAK